MNHEPGLSLFPKVVKLAGACWLAGGVLAHAATFYVDFAAGSDANSGLAPSAAWQRAPGDPAARGMAGGTELKPGDTVLFKGGVTYRGSISIKASGTGESPIVLKGDGWGTEKARLDGSDPWQPKWTACPSPESCSGNPEYSKIYCSPAPPGYATYRTGLYEDGDFLWYSQGPDPADPFHYDIISEYHRIPVGSERVRQTRTSITDSTRLIQTNPDFWIGAYIATWIQGNLVATKQITSFDPTTHTVVHEDLGGNPYTDRDGYYSILNHASLISRPGEYAHDPTGNRIFLWPRHSDDPNGRSYCVQTRDTAFSSPASSHVVIEGFVIQRFAQARAGLTRPTRNRERTWRRSLFRPASAIGDPSQGAQPSTKAPIRWSICPFRYSRHLTSVATSVTIHVELGGIGTAARWNSRIARTSGRVIECAGLRA